MGTGSEQAEAGCLETGDQGLNVADSELDLNFPVCRHTRQYKAGQY
jgi:hypothetical protein